MPERTTGDNNDIEQVALEALAWRKSLSVNGISPGEAVGHIFLENGRSTLKKLLTPHSQDGIAHNIDYYTGKLNRTDFNTFKTAWAKVFIGVLLKHIDRTPFDSWSTKMFLTEVNLAFDGTPLPPINLTDETVAFFKKEDKLQTAFITKTLIANKKPGCFFEHIQLFEKLTPVMKILESYWRHEPTADVLEQGRFAQECLDYIKVVNTTAPNRF